MKIISEKIKIKLIDYFHLLFKSAADNHIRIQRCIQDPNGEVKCDIVFNSYSSLKRFQKKLRRITLSLSGTIILIFVSTLVTQLLLPVFKSKAATFDWVQTNWAGGISALVSHNPDGSNDTTNISTYASKDNGIDASVANVLSLAAQSDTETQTSEVDFTSGVISDTSVSQTSGSVELLKNMAASSSVAQTNNNGGTDETALNKTGSDYGSSSTEISGTGDSAKIRNTLQTLFTDGAINITSSCTGTGISGTYPNCLITGGTYYYTSFNLGAGANLSATGTTPLTIYVEGAVTIAGSLKANGGNGGANIAGVGVAGGSNGVSNVCAASGILYGYNGLGSGGGYGGYGNFSDVNRYATGGGGSYGGLGGYGGYRYTTLPVSSPYRNPGSTYATFPSGGSGGGGSTTKDYSYNCTGIDDRRSGSGAGGGSITLKSFTNINVNLGGGIYANGGNGYTVTSFGDTGAGGSGGAIALHAPVVVNSGSITASGGSGGNNTYQYDHGGLTGGGGGGGRIRVYTTSGTGFSGTIPVSGGGLGGVPTVSCGANPCNGTNGSSGEVATNQPFASFAVFTTPGRYSSYLDSGDVAGATRNWTNFVFAKSQSGDAANTFINFKFRTSSSKDSAPDFSSCSLASIANSNKGYNASDTIDVEAYFQNNSGCFGSTDRYIWYQAVMTANSAANEAPYLESAQVSWNNSYKSSGTFISKTINTGQKTKNGSTVLSWSETLPGGLSADSVKLQISSSNETYSDNFDGGSLNTSKWSQYAAAQPVTQSAGGLITDTTATAGKYSGAWLANAITVGDFDIQTDFNIEEGYPSGCAAGSYPHYAALNYFATSGGSVDWNNSLRLTRFCNAGGGEGYMAQIYIAGVATNKVAMNLADTNGKLRLVRQGSNFYAYYWNNSANSWTLLTDATFLNKTSFPTTTGKINVWSTNSNTAVKLRAKFDNFIVWGDNNGDTSGGYFGSDGTTGTYYANEAGTSLHSDHNGSQYFRYKATLENGGATTLTPTLDAVNLNYQYYGNTGPVALYHFDGKDGASVANATTIYDATKNGNNGTFSNVNNSVSPTTGYADQTGNLDGLGTAMTFDGVDDRVLVTDNDSISLGSQITVEAWTKLSDTSIVRTVVNKGNEYWLRFTNNTQGFSFYLYDGVDWEPGVHMNSAPTIGEWYHLVGTWDGTTQKLYVNGVLKQSATHSFTASSTANNLDIGAATMNGQIDEVAIFNRALSEAEIKNHYNAGTPSHIKSGSQPASLVSSVFDSSDIANVITGFKLNGTSVYDNSMKVQLRSSADNSTWTNWCGLNSCSGSDYINITSANLNSMQSFVAGHPFLNELSQNDDRYFQYKLSLESNGSNTPTVTEATTQYVVNQTPTVTNVTASQDSSGVVNVAYDLADGDNVSETVYVLADLGETLNEVLSNSDTTAITLSSASNLPTSGTIQIDNEQISYTSKSGNDLTGTIARGANNTRAMAHSSGATIWIKGTTVSGDVGASVAVGAGKSIAWTIKSDLNGIYYAAARVRISANDGQAANQIGSGDSIITGFRLDTKNPIVNSFSVISSTSDPNKTNDNTQDLSISTTEDNATGYQMRFSNDGVTWAGWENYATSKSQWNLTDNIYGGSATDGTKTVYVQFRDANGNIASSNDAITYDTTSPGIPDKLKVQDASNENTATYRTFLSWEANVNAAGDFAKYHVYYATSVAADSNPSTAYQEITPVITDPSVNYIIHNNLDSTKKYYYKITTEDGIANVSSDSLVVKTVPDGSGGASISAPTISNLTVVEKGTTWARLTWDTGELSDSRVYYSTGAINESTSDSVLVPTMKTTGHEVVISGLQPGTTYNFRAKSINAISNSDIDDTTGTTNSGARISGVIIPEVYNTKAKIKWNIDAVVVAGKVYYTSSLDGNNLPDFSLPSQQSATCSATVCEAQLSGLTAGYAKYYFYVEADNATDKNIDHGQIKYFTFTTANDLIAPQITASGSPIGQPIVKSDNQAVVRWTTDETSIGRVLYKESGGSYNDPSWSSAYSRDNVLVLSGLSRNTTYVYKIQTKDVNDNQSESSEYTFTTLAEQENHPDLTDPGDPTINNIIYAGETEAIIKWQSNTETTARICYGTIQITDMNSCANEVNSSTASIIHAFHLENLTAGQTYYYRVKTTDAVNTGITFASSDSALINFVTDVASDVAAPNLSGYSVVSTSPDSAIISVTSGENSIAFIQYLDTTTGFATDYLEKSSSKEYTATHTVNLKNLSQNKTYYFKIKLQDGDGNTAVYDNSGLYYTFSTATGPDISGDPSCSVKENSITINWETDEESDSYVLYSIESDLDGYLKKGSSSSEETHKVTIEGLLPQTEYFYQASSRNSVGGVTTSDIESCTTLGTGVDSVAPSISNVQAVFIGKNQALINWNTDEVATSQVEYDETKTYSEATTRDNDMVTNHNIIVTGLDAGTIYHFRVLSEDASGNEDISDDYTFTTLGEQVSEDTLGNVISETTEVPDISSSNATVSENDGDSVTITWKTDKEANSLVAYKPEGSDTYKTEGSDAEFVTSHEVVLTNLSPNTKYTFYVKSTDSLGNVGQSGTDTFTTSATSTIFNVEVVDISYDGATISWETSMNTSSLIEYGKTSSFGDETDEDTDKTKAHAVKISGLDSGAKYYFRIKGKDSSSNLYTSSEYNFTTPAPPQIADFKVDSITEHKIKVAFKTNIETDAFLTLSKKDAKEDDENSKVTSGDPKMGIEHSLEADSLESGTTYTLEVQVRDKEGNATIQKIDDYTTAKDENPPKVDQIRTESALTQNDKVQAIISWKTDEPASTQVIFREGRNGQEKEVNFNDNLVSSHTAVITTFKPGTVYYFKVKSIDAAGNEGKSTDFALLTPKRKENIIQIIVNNFQDIFGWAQR